MLFTLKKRAFLAFKKSESFLHELNYLFWECTRRCNLNCLHCGSDCSKESTVTDMPLDDFLAAIDTIINPTRNLTVVFTGGEPLMRSDIEKCGREIRRRGMRWSLVSNGQLYDRQKHIALLNAGLGALTFSLDGMEGSHNWLRNSPGSFNAVTKAIDLAVSSQRLNFDIVTCVNPRNISELPEMLEFLVFHKVKAWRLFTIFPIGRAEDKHELILPGEMFRKLMDFITESRKAGKICISFSCEGYVGDYELKVRDSFFFCRAGINIGSILADGSVSACPNNHKSFIQGNIYTDNFFDVWQKRYDIYRHRNWTKTGICSACREYSYCEGNGAHNWQGDPLVLQMCHWKSLNNSI